MAIEAAILRPASRVLVSRPVNRTFEHVFFSGMAILLCVCVYIGFSPTYFQAGMLRAALPSPILHVHGAIFTLWMLLFVVQATLVSAHRVKWHRLLGTVAFCLPPIMIVLGVVAALDALRRGVRIGPLLPTVSFAIPMLGIAAFTVVIYASWRARRRPDAHKRLILLATIGLVEAAFGRFPWARMGFPPAAGAVYRTRRDGAAGDRLRSRLAAPTSPLHHVGCTVRLRFRSFGGSYWHDASMACVRHAVEPDHRTASVGGA